MTIPTIPRAKWHRAKDRWQVQDSDGRLWSTYPEPFVASPGDRIWTAIQFGGPSGPVFNRGPKRLLKVQFRTTLRKIRPSPATKGTK